jgi:hypothetical protein
LRSWRAAGGAANTVGNVPRITDAAASGGSQAQAFGYEALDRLITATATSGAGIGERARARSTTDPLNLAEGAERHSGD